MDKPHRPRVPAGLLVMLVVIMSITPARAASPARPAFASKHTHTTALPLKATGPLSPRLAILARSTRHAQHAGSLSQELSLPARGPGSLLETSTGEILVYLWMDAPGRQSYAALRAAGAHIVHASPQYGMVTAFVDPSRLDAVAAVAGVTHVREALEPTARGNAPRAEPPATMMTRNEDGEACSTGQTVSEGDALLRAAEARAHYGVDGTGVTVGVLSGSFDVETFTQIDAADDSATGDLPGPGNPCGRTTPVQVLAESRLGAGRDEGRAMLQIIHDLAPGAHLVFANASDGLYAYAENIRRLRREAGADVIVDDYFYPEEPFFQDGPIDVAINDVTADGAIYVTAGGNIHLEDPAGNHIGSYEAPSYRPVACPALVNPETGAEFVPGADCHDFNPGNAADAEIDITLPVNGSVIVNFQWAEPWFGVQTDLDIYLVDEARAVLAESAGVLGPYPFEFLAYSNTTGVTETVRLVAARFSGGTPRFKFTLGSAALSIVPPIGLEYADVPSEDIFGPTASDHGVSANAISVAAAPFDNPLNPEPFSSYGPAMRYWAQADAIRPAPALSAPEVRAKPDIAAIDGVHTTFYGRTARDGGRCDPASEVCRFFGTSAAAPHTAAIVALMKQRADLYGVPLDQRRAELLLEMTAMPMNGSSEVRGAGLIDALAAVGMVPEVGDLPPPPGVLMPDLLGLNEQEARTILLNLGIPLEQMVVDYQDRGKLGELFDQIPAYHVVSTQPRSGVELLPGQVVVLGVRAPEPQ